MKKTILFQSETLFTSFLKLLNVKCTTNFSDKYFNEHPHKYNLYGLSKMLSDYGVENAATKIEDKENNIYNIETPFIAFTGSDFIPVYKVSAEGVSYISKNGDISITPKDFCNLWTGITLLAETNSKSIEPNYKENRKNELLGLIQTGLLLFSIFTILVLSYIFKLSYHNLGLTIELLINFLGVYIGYLLVQKQIHIQSEYADKICTLFKKSDCNNVLESDAAKLFGFIGWSEIGLGYFISNILVLFFLPHLIFYLAIINICALPYSFWSIWYQKVKAKEWCPLCLIVQGLLWAIFAINLKFSFVQIPVFSISDTLMIACVYISAILLINVFASKLGKDGMMEQITQEINSIKADESTFLSLLKKQTYYKVDKSTSKILFGNTNADILVTIFTNPHCNPCAQLHARVDEFLKQTDKLCIQYIFTSFEESLDESNKFLISSYLNNRNEKVRKIYSEWFSRGKSTKEDFFQIYETDILNKKVVLEFEKHESWKMQTGLRSTPTILVNGYKLPDNYKIEDLRFFSKL